MSNPEEFYTESQRKLQRENDSDTLATAMATAIVAEEIADEHAEFINSRDFFFLSSVNAKGQPTVSYKGGSVGFVHVENPTTLLFPNYDGNGMFLSMGNIAETAHVGLLFIDMEVPHRLRVQGTAKVSADAERIALYPGCNLIVEIDVQSVFINCARYIHKHKRIESSKYSPDKNGEQPFPAWKRLDMLQEVLPEKDQGKATESGGIIDNEKYRELLSKGES